LVVVVVHLVTMVLEQVEEVLFLELVQHYPQHHMQLLLEQVVDLANPIQQQNLIHQAQTLHLIP
tara:strand:- start:516 stop:707 length:192 start_codon:yes stop_codon:yes gene_type:complete